jgi:hypothetical protein
VNIDEYLLRDDKLRYKTQNIRIRRFRHVKSDLMSGLSSRCAAITRHVSNVSKSELNKNEFKSV